jgi:Rrf2 family protein
MISQASRYALRALAYLATHDTERFLPVRRLGEALDISVPFLAKILNQLVTAGLLRAHRGPTGGVRLALPADQISVRRVIEEIDGDDLFTECVLGLPGCGDEAPCPMHGRWVAIRTAVAASFAQQSIGDLALGYDTGTMRLRP